MQFKLAELKTEVEALRSLCYRATEELRRGRRFTLLASMAKLKATEAAQKIALEGMQMMGGYGYSSEYDMERLVRSALVATIYGGTTEIQRNIIAKTLGL